MIKLSPNRISRENFDQSAQNEVCFSEEQKHIWEKMIRIKRLKKDNHFQKKSLLRKTTMRLN